MATRQRVEFQPAYLLHSYPWRETSLIVEVFSREHGRLSLVAKGARRPLSVLRGVLMAFQPLSLSWMGRGEVKNLVQAEWQGGQPLLQGVALLCAYYLNELLLRMLAREDAHANLFDAYARTLACLAAGQAYAPLMRAFELTLLRELGYAPSFDCEAESGEAIDPAGRYVFLMERGAIAAGDHGDAPTIPGQALLAMAAADFSDVQTLMHAKPLMRRLIQHHLDGPPLESRRILMELQEL